MKKQLISWVLSTFENGKIILDTWRGEIHLEMKFRKRISINRQMNFDRCEFFCDCRIFWFCLSITGKKNVYACICGFKIRLTVIFLENIMWVFQCMLWSANFQSIKILRNMNSRCKMKDALTTTTHGYIFGTCKISWNSAFCSISCGGWSHIAQKLPLVFTGHYCNWNTANKAM